MHDGRLSHPCSRYARTASETGYRAALEAQGVKCTDRQHLVGASYGWNEAGEKWTRLTADCRQQSIALATAEPAGRRDLEAIIVAKPSLGKDRKLMP